MVATRRGTTLVELLATVPLLALLALACALLVLNGQRVSRSVDGRTARTREMRHSAAIIATLLRDTRSRDLHAWNDTLIEFDMTSGFAFACGNSQSAIYLLTAPDSDPLRPTWSSLPDVGDDLHVAVAAATPAEPPKSRTTTITGIGASSTACANSTLRKQLGGNTIRLSIAPPLTDIVAGTPVRITRRSRISLYKSSDNDWYLGTRSLTPSGWEAIQPASGPFASASDRGLRFEVIARNGTVLTAKSTATQVDTNNATAPVAIRLLLRAAAKWKDTNGRTESDSLLTTITVRNK